MIDNVFIISSLGEILIEKHYLTAGVSRTVISDFFWEKEINSASSKFHPLLDVNNSNDNNSNKEGVNDGLLELDALQEDESNENDCHPIVLLKNTNKVIVHIKRGELTFVASISRDVPPLLVIEFLNNIADVLEEYIGNLNEVKIRDAFSTVYQLLEEMADGGIPMITEVSEKDKKIFKQSPCLHNTHTHTQKAECFKTNDFRSQPHNSSGRRVDRNLHVKH